MELMNSSKNRNDEQIIRNGNPFSSEADHQKQLSRETKQNQPINLSAFLIKNTNRNAARILKQDFYLELGCWEQNDGSN